MTPTCAALLTIQSVAAYAMQQRQEIIAGLKATARTALKQELSDLVGRAYKMATLYQTLGERAQAGLNALNAAPTEPAPPLPKAEKQEAAIIGWQQSVLLAADPDADLDAALAALDAASADPRPPDPDDDIIF